jgi:phage terminase small subunit
MALTEKQKRFVNEYLIDLNATQAAIRSGYSENTAAEQGNRLLRNVKVQEAIESRMKEREERTEITQDRVLLELAAIAFANGADYSKIVTKQGHDIDGNPVEYSDVELKNTDELTAEQKKAIAGIKQTKFGIVVETCDKVKALELLGKHLGMFRDKVELSGEVRSEKLSDVLAQLGGEGLEE